MGKPATPPRDDIDDCAFHFAVVLYESISHAGAGRHPAAKRRGGTSASTRDEESA